MCLWAAEKAKIELSAKEESVITLTESDLGVADESGAEVYVDIPFDRAQLDALIASRYRLTATRTTSSRAERMPSASAFSVDEAARELLRAVRSTRRCETETRASKTLKGPTIGSGAGNP